MLVNKLGVDVLLLMLCRLSFCKSFQSDDYVNYDLNNSASDFLIWFHRNRFQTLNLCWSLKYNFFMLYIKLIIKLDKRQIEANSDCPEHNGTDINRPVCVQVGILIAFQKLQRWYVGRVNMTQFPCFLYTQG